MDPVWIELQARLNKSEKIIDLGCGNNPHPRSTVAVDAFLEPAQRAMGKGPQIATDQLQQRGIQFVQADLSTLPFSDKQFDFAYSHHAFEHLPDPQKACGEMCRVAKAGAIITPSIFAEIAFGRPYHLWFVVARGNTLIFIRKTAKEDRPFGGHPVKVDKGYRVLPQSNPFDILLNDGGWYAGSERMPRLSNLLQIYWYGHSPVMEVVFLWKNSLNCLVIHEDGDVE